MNTHIALKGSRRIKPLAGPEVGKLVVPMTATLTLRSKCQPFEIDNRLALIAAGHEGFISPQELPKYFGASDEDYDAVARELRKRGFEPQIAWPDQCFGNVRIKGEPDQINSLFDVTMVNRDVEGGIYRAPKGIVKVPSNIAHIITSVHRLDKAPVAKPKYVRSGAEVVKRLQSALAKHGVRPHDGFPALWPSDIYALQGVPVAQLWKEAGLDTWYISLGGDCNNTIRQALSYVAGKTGLPLANYLAQAVAGGKVDGDASDPATVEVILDAIAHGALPGWILNFVADNDDDSFCSAAETGVSFVDPAGKINLTNGSVSWGARFDNFPQATLTVRWPKIGKASRLTGRFIFVASGDNGATDEQGAQASKGKHAGGSKPKAGKPKYGVDCPSCIPGFISVGGDKLIGTADGITGRTMWSTNGAAGCGVSPFPPIPEELALGVSFKSANPGHATGSGVPTIIDDASPESGPNTPIPDGSGGFSEQPVGGTSYAAPAACKKLTLARIKGDLINFLYGHAGTPVFIRTSGAIGPYTADPDAEVDDCQGLGEVNWQAAKAAGGNS